MLGWPFFTPGCELGAPEPTVSEQLCKIEAAELFYFESAIRDALDLDIIESADPRAEALSLRAAVEGILARARILNDPDELSALTELPMNLLRGRSLAEKQWFSLHTKRRLLFPERTATPGSVVFHEPPFSSSCTSLAARRAMIRRALDKFDSTYVFVRARIRASR